MQQQQQCRVNLTSQRQIILELVGNADLELDLKGKQGQFIVAFMALSITAYVDNAHAHGTMRALCIYKLLKVKMEND